MKKTRLLLGFGLGIALSLTGSIYGEVISVRQFRLGEEDGPEVSTRPSSSLDSIGGGDLVMHNGPHYSLDDPGVNSCVSLYFNGWQSASTELAAPLIGQFGVEVWVKPSTVSHTAYILYLGNGAKGFGIQVDESGQFRAVLDGGNTVFGKGAATAGEWSHVALFCDGVSTTFYLNGAAAGTVDAVLSTSAGMSLTLAARSAAEDRALFRGHIDEVRVFTPWQGGFTTDDLLYTEKGLSTMEVNVIDGPMPEAPVAKSSVLPKSLTVGPLTVLRHFKMGEADSGAVAGAAVTQTADSASSNPLTMTGDPHYSADSPQYSGELTMDFSGANRWGSTPNPDALTTNFGVETWVKPVSASGTRFILYSGTAGSGWGIVQQDGMFKGIFGGRTYLGEGEIKVGVWTHLAFAVTGETATFYVNGVPSGPTVMSNPSAPEATLFIGTSPTLGAYIGGQVDEVRIFTFAPGAFTPDLLLYKPPVPLAFARDGGNATLSWPMDYPAFSLQTTTDLTAPWLPVYAPARVAGNYTVTQGVDPQRFYRLKQDAGVNEAPRLPEGKYIVVTSNGIAKNVTDGMAANTNRIVGNQSSTVGASAFIDPANPNGGQYPLEFHWILRYPQLDDPYSAAGITGYHSSVIGALSNSFASQPNPANQSGAGVQFLLEVFSPVSGLTTVVDTRIQIVLSALSLTMYNDCQTQVEACAQCICTIANALPTIEPQ